MNAIDLFAGPGGWDVGARELGIEPLGIEYDDAACETRRAAGHPTLQGDVSKLDPLEVAPDGCDLLIASPPCQAWSMAGSRQGEHDREEVYALARHWGHGADDWAIWADERSPLAAEPMRWVDALEPALVTFEQVPPVLPLWQLCASLMAERGYAVWTGLLSAERYGVPQTRKRAILMASKIGGVHPPLPTHLPYVAGDPKPTEPLLTLEGGAPAVGGMAEALGWGMTERPMLSVAAGTEAGGADSAMVGGSGARASLDRERANGDWALKAGTQDNDVAREAEEPAATLRFGERGNAVDWIIREETPRPREAARSLDEPAPTIMSKGGASKKVFVPSGGERPNAAARTEDEPASTIFIGHDQPKWIDEPPTSLNTGRDWKKGGTREDAQTISTEAPSPAIDSQANKMQWVDDRPATTVNCDPRIAEPGHKGTPDEGDKYGGPHMTNAVRVSVAEASVLQSFPADYPWQGSRTKQFQQIGNAVPPRMARAVLEALIA